MNPNPTPSSQGSEGHSAIGCGGPQDSVVGVTHGGGDPAPEPDSTAGATAVGGALTMTEPVLGASSA
jgi:hypothetical protein